jgi:cellulose synthase (UDP-forming)
MTAVWTTLWLVSSLILIALLAQPISLATHLALGVTAVAVIAVLKMFHPRGLWRAIFLAFGTAVVLRYVYWRTTSSLPPVEPIANFIPGVLLYLAEMYSVGILAISLFVVSDPLRRASAPRLTDAQLPTVDVFIPTFNEDKTILAMTIAAARDMDYPAGKLAVYLLDDGGTDQKCNSPDHFEAEAARERREAMRQLATGLGATYLTRERNEHAKAGNLNAALAKTKGELVAVFDADHAPTSDFLTETVGFFEREPKLFLVQTPHFFINPDPIEYNLKTFNRMASENDQFYGMVQRGLDKWNASFFCGSAAVLRRRALEETNGFAGLSITEDCETALELHARGWTSIYVEKPLIAGLQPDTYSSFIGQRSRWAQGMTQVLMLKNPMFKRGLTFAQRICYMSSLLYWLFPFSRLIFLFSPLLYLFFGLQIFVSSGKEFLAYTLVYVIINMLMQNALYGKFRWPWLSEIYEYLQCVYLGRAVLSAVFNPRRPVFKVTAKGETSELDQISSLGWPFYGIFALLVLGVGATIWRMLIEPMSNDVTLVVGGWNLFNLLLAGCALGVVAERRNLRQAPRIELSRPAELIVDGETIPVMIEDGSMSGVRILVKRGGIGAIAPGTQGEVRFVPSKPLPSDRMPVVVRDVGVLTNGDTQIGCSVAPTEPAHARLLADLVYSDSARWQALLLRRRVEVGVVRGTLFVIFKSLVHAIRGISYIYRTRASRRASRRRVA